VILYVQDDPASVKFMRDLVSTFEDAEIIVAPTADVGVELARARRPNVIIMDIDLPGVSGIDALHALHATPETGKIPVIALTGASERDRQRREREGFHRCLTQPVRVGELERVLRSLLSAARSARLPPW
jgi:CheY-like chemotaxis protein